MSVSCSPVFQISSLITISRDLTVAHGGVACHRATEGRVDICSKGPWQRTKDPVVFLLNLGPTIWCPVSLFTGLRVRASSENSHTIDSKPLWC